MVIANNGTVQLLPYQREDAIALLDQGRSIVPLWIDQIHKILEINIRHLQQLRFFLGSSGF